MGGVVVLFIVMLVMAAVVFAPLGYFIYQFQQNHATPFGETEVHGDSPSVINDFAESVIHFVQRQCAKK